MEAPTRNAVGGLLREWRLRRDRSQLSLALDTGVSTRHLSYVENGRARPSAEVVLRLAEHLDVPLRDRNALLLAAGFAPRFGHRDLDDPDLAPVHDAVRRVLQAHEPYPAVVVDRHWGMVAANGPLLALTAGVDPALLAPPVNVLRLTLHPDGLAPRIANHAAWRGHVLEVLAREAATTGDPALAALHAELDALPGGREHPTRDRAAADIAVPLRLRGADGEELSFLATRTVFGSAVDVTVAELAIESFFPADDGTARHLRGAS
jgi:transcriptional regulator with XRE-family HTH domain